MAKSSMHFQAVKSGSEDHNLRRKPLSYVREELSHKNGLYGFNLTIAEERQRLEILVKEKTGRAMQKKATPIREGVFLFEEHHTDEDLKAMVNGLQERFGIRPLQLAIHRDEGHFERHTGQWMPNYHAHVVCSWIDETTGKSVKLDRQALSEMQTYVAESLNMERGEKSTKTHLNALEWKIQKTSERLQEVNQELQQLKEELQVPKATLQELQEITSKPRFDLFGTKTHKRSQKALKSLLNVKKQLENDLLSARQQSGTLFAELDRKEERLQSYHKAHNNAHEGKEALAKALFAYANTNKPPSKEELEQLFTLAKVQDKDLLKSLGIDNQTPGRKNRL